MFKKRINAQKSRELFLNSFEPLSQIEILPIEECDGRIIAENIIAGIDVPHYRRAAMDGFAVMASETLGAGTGSPVILRLANTMEKGACIRVHTGSPMPEKSDAVVMMEDTVFYGDKVEIFTQIHPLKNVGAIGEDVQKGENIITRECLLRPCDIAVLASLGIGNIKVFKRPLVVIIPTGEEIVPRWKVFLPSGHKFLTCWNNNNKRPFKNLDIPNTKGCKNSDITGTKQALPGYDIFTLLYIFPYCPNVLEGMDLCKYLNLIPVKYRIFHHNDCIRLFWHR